MKNILGVFVVVELPRLGIKNPLSLAVFDAARALDKIAGHLVVDDRHFDFLASRFWTHRKLWETGYVGEMPIYDPDLPSYQQPTLQGLALPTEVIQKLYHQNATNLLDKIGMPFIEVPDRLAA